MKRVVVLLSAVLLSGTGAWLYLRRFPAKPQQFEILPGASTRTVGQALAARGWILHPLIFQSWARWTGSSHRLKPGAYQVSPRWTAPRFLREFRRGPGVFRVTFPEGWRASQMAEALESAGITSGSVFLELVKARDLEGRLFPETYAFAPKTSPDKVMDAIVAEFERRKPASFSERARALQLTERQLLTLASLVEREARAPEERALVAGVFYNRLKKRWRLESCATVQYALGYWKKNLTYKDLEIASPYNTYRHFGLPPGPICNPGLAAMEAAMSPRPTDQMFFVADGEGTHRFSRYYAEHLRLKRKWEREGSR